MVLESHEKQVGTCRNIASIIASYIHTPKPLVTIQNVTVHRLWDNCQWSLAAH